jgi:hypothetical protein
MSSEDEWTMLSWTMSQTQQQSDDSSQDDLQSINGSQIRHGPLRRALVEKMNLLDKRKPVHSSSIAHPSLCSHSHPSNMSKDKNHGRATFPALAFRQDQIRFRCRKPVGQCVRNRSNQLCAALVHVPSNYLKHQRMFVLSCFASLPRHCSATWHQLPRS